MISNGDCSKNQIVILSEAKNLIFFFSSQKIKKEILRTSSSGWHEKVNLQKFWNTLFIIIPSEEIQNPDSLLIENLAGFDIVYFKNIYNLSLVIYREFYKIWKNFEGTIIVDYFYYSFLDFDPTKIQIFHIIDAFRLIFYDIIFGLFWEKGGFDICMQ
jgi:hypothetical protein